jgi:hypothetical protein
MSRTQSVCPSLLVLYASLYPLHPSNRRDGPVTKFEGNSETGMGAQESKVASTTVNFVSVNN